MSRLRAPALALAAAVAVAVLSAAPDVSAAGAAPKHGPGAMLVDLVVKNENVAAPLAPEAKRNAYIDQTRLYSLRDRTNLLEATLQISRMVKSAPYASPSFQLNLVQQVGSDVPIVLRARGDTVYVTSIRTLKIACWFRAGHLFVLAVRDTYTRPKQLLWDALAVQP